MVEIWLYGLISAGALIAAYLTGAVNGVHYLPTDRERVERMLRMARLMPGDRLIDLGSGDGRIVKEAALQGARAYGYELNPIMVILSHGTVRGLDGASVHWKDFWRTDLSTFDVVTVYGIPHIMKRLEKKLEQELPPGARVVCNLFPLPTWQGTHEDGVYLYIRP